MRCASFALFYFLVTMGSGAGATALPEWSFRVLRSEHFELIYREEQKALAKRYIIAAEQAHELLSPIFKEVPDKTLIYLSDDSDASNGLANFLPYPMITVYPVLPSTLDSIDDYGDWPLEMMVHEYTHILNMYPAHGFYVPLKYIFGGVVRPNAVLPKWYLEGLAVNMESRLTDHGRLRTDENQANARALVLGEKLRFETLPQINEQDLSSWPYGARPYMFGGWWWDTVQSKHGGEIIETWNQNFARRIPFFLNGPMIEKTNNTPGDLLELSADRSEAEAKNQLKILRSSKRHASTLVVDEKGEVNVFAVSPSGDKLVYWLSRPTLGSEVKVRARSFPTESFHDLVPRRLFKAVGSLRVRWLDEARFVFDQLDIKKPHVSYRDLFMYDFNRDSVERLTDGLRAQEPSPSPAGDQIAFIQNDGGRNRLMLLPLATKQPRTLVNGNYKQRLSGPEFFNDHEIVFAMRTLSGVEKLYVYDLKERKVRPWNTTLQAAQNPRKTEKGILVSDSGTHVRNIFLVASDKATPYAVTNTLTHIETADYDANRKELLISELTPEGNKLQSTPFAIFTPPEIEAVAMAKPPVPKTTSAKIVEESYQPLAYLWPRYWIPFAYTLENNGWLVQGSTSNNDPAGRNSYSAFGSYDTITKKPSYGLNYINSSLPVDLGASYAKSVSFLGASLLTLESQTAAVTMVETWPNRFTKWNLGGLWNETQSSVIYRRIGPQAGVSYSRLQHPLNIWSGFQAEAYVQEFLKEPNYISYDRYYVHLAEIIHLGGGHKVFLQGRGALAPDLPFANVIDLGDRSVGANYLVSLANSDFLLRGYPSGTFIGRKVLNANLEYSLPLVEMARGWGSFPLFWRATELAIFADAMSVDGGAFRSADNGYFRSRLSNYFMSTGAELRLSTTAGYHLPVNFTLGAYYGLNQRYGGGFTPFLGLGLGDLGVLENKTP